jgi:hypothetical protein
LTHYQEVAPGSHHPTPPAKIECFGLLRQNGR